MMFRSFLTLTVLVCVFNCKQKEAQINDPESADTIITKSIEVAGGELFDHAIINFDFRDKHFKAVRDNWKYQLERQFSDSLSEIRDVLSNSGFERFRDGVKVELADSLVAKFSPSVNSVHYFSVLPYGLKGKAVHKEYIGTKNINDKEYHKIKVTFSEDGGGEDFDDKFIYWINTESYTVDYMAYSYKESDGMGFRFREAYNVSNIEGLRFADYNNYKPVNSDITLEDMDNLFSAGKLELLSKIELKNIDVQLLN